MTRPQQTALGWSIFLYIFIGAMTFVYCWGDNNDALNMPATDAAGIAVLWPLFLIKYLAIGVWLVLSSGFTLLIGA